MGEVTTATTATTPKNITPTTFRSISRFALPSMHHNNSPLLLCPIFKTSATALCGTTGILLPIEAIRLFRVYDALDREKPPAAMVRLVSTLLSLLVWKGPLIMSMSTNKWLKMYALPFNLSLTTSKSDFFPCLMCAGRKGEWGPAAHRSWQLLRDLFLWGAMLDVIHNSILILSFGLGYPGRSRVGTATVGPK